MDTGNMKIRIGMGHSPNQEGNVSQYGCLQKEGGEGQDCKENHCPENPDIIPVLLLPFSQGSEAGICLHAPLTDPFLLRFLLSGRNFFPNQVISQPEACHRTEKAQPGRLRPVRLQSGKLQAGNPLSSHKEQGKQRFQIQKISAFSAVPSIKPESGKKKSSSRQIVMGAGCKQHSGAITNHIYKHSAPILQGRFPPAPQYPLMPVPRQLPRR